LKSYHLKEKILIVEDEFILANGLLLMLENAGFEVCELAESVLRAREIIKKEKPTLVILDIQLDGKLTGVDLAHELRAAGIGFIYLSANSSQPVLEAAKLTEPYGFIVKPYRQKDVLIAIDIARYRQQQKKEAKIRRQQLLQNNLSQISSNTITNNQRFLQIALAIQQDIQFDIFTISYTNPLSGLTETLGLQRVNFSEYIIIEVENHHKKAYVTDVIDLEPAYFNGEAFRNACKEDLFKRNVAEKYGMQSSLQTIFLIEKRKLCFSFFSHQPIVYEPAHLDFLKDTVAILGPLFESIFSAKQYISSSRQNVNVEKKGGQTNYPAFQQIIGKSAALLQVFDHVSKVATMDTTVLILGESGTGKEKIAKSIHELSNRKHKPFVIVNCAALPVNLIESELFGHEKGAFTGATEKRIGKFEQASEGSIFLDEIGELPIDLQVKLLRTLQEKEVERIGGNKLIKLDVRVIAATNRNLEKEVAEGRFRLDLYYRLNAFPIIIPPLRERKEDIPLLANHFLKEFVQKSGRELTIATYAMEQLIKYPWPGNIRELHHVIERSAVLSSFTSIEEFSLPQLSTNENNFSSNAGLQSMEDAEKNHIINALKKSNNRIYGPGGAAELLKLPPTTLASKIKKLGIDKSSL
jgi:DNA-binding NtrC family response regulator